MATDENAEKLRKALEEQEKLDAERRRKLAEQEAQEKIKKAAHEALGQKYPHDK